ncbi:MAG: DUF3881 family protein [Acidobacteriota bacterium]|nr:DUF3881 family protein [Blastocatellia bacterium]MDW8413396.1 DUF3881 family protein [Acidobacteriota bacterium]
MISAFDSAFEAVGFYIPDDDAYASLARQAAELGSRRTIHLRGAKLHGCCFKIGQGLEVWAVVYEPEQGTSYYADCRPAFRPLRVYTLDTWKLTEYYEDGEAMLRGIIAGSELVFELQNLTELEDSSLRRSHLYVAIAGLGYSAKVYKKALPAQLVPAVRVPENTRTENNYALRGQVLAFKEIKNAMTGSDLVWVCVDVGNIELETIFNSRRIKGKLAIGKAISARVWLQGYVLNDKDIEARYEGVDKAYQVSDFWLALKRVN